MKASPSPSASDERNCV